MILRARSRIRPAVFIAIALSAGTTGLRAAQAAPDRGRTVTGLSIQYADGRTIYRPLTPTRGSSWTPLFPQIPGANTDREDLPLAALDIAHVMRGQDAVVAVALLYGRPHQHRIEVATVTVKPGTPTRVDQLTAFGVEPISFSIVPIPTLVANAPVVTTPSPSLDATVEVAPGGGTTYLVVVVNRSSRSLRGFRVEGERGGRKAISGYRKGKRHAMLIPPGRAFIFELPATMMHGLSGSARVLPIDRLAITSATWDDDSVEGDKEPDAYERAAAAGIARQLPHILSLMRDASDHIRPQSPVEFRAKVTALTLAFSNDDAVNVRASLPAPEVIPIERVVSAMRLGMQQAKEAVLADLDAALSKPSADVPSFGHWLASGTMEYENWLTRLKHFVGVR